MLFCFIFHALSFTACSLGNSCIKEFAFLPKYDFRIIYVDSLFLSRLLKNDFQNMFEHNAKPCGKIDDSIYIAKRIPMFKYIFF